MLEPVEASLRPPSKHSTHQIAEPIHPLVSPFCTNKTRAEDARRVEHATRYTRAKLDDVSGAHELALMISCRRKVLNEGSRRKHTRHMAPSIRPMAIGAKPAYRERGHVLILDQLLLIPCPGQRSCRWSCCVPAPYARQVPPNLPSRVHPRALCPACRSCSRQ